jgi:hypothetical protein
MKRLTLYWKLKNSVAPQAILEKELSLSGIQRPVNHQIMYMYSGQGHRFFQLGEFGGWIITK